MAATTTDEVRVIVVAGRCDYTNYVQASNKFGNSKIGMSRLQTAFKTTSTMLEHHDQKIIKTLNSDQPTPLCVFSRSVKPPTRFVFPNRSGWLYAVTPS